MEVPEMPVERVKSAYECKGVNVVLHYLKLYVPPTHCRVQCTLYDGTTIVKTDDSKLCNWACKPVDTTHSMFTRGGDNPMNAGMAYTPSGLARGEILSIEDEATWIKDLFRVYKARQQDINLVFQIMEYTKGRNYNAEHEIKQDYMPIGYGVLKLNNPDGTIRYGTYEVEFYKPPVNLNKRNPVHQLKQSLKVTIGQPMFGRPADNMY